MARNSLQVVLAAARVDWAVGVASIAQQDGGFSGITTTADGNASLTLLAGNFANKRDCYVEVHRMEVEVPGQLNSSTGPIVVLPGDVPTGVIQLTQLMEQAGGASILRGQQCWVVVKQNVDIGA